MAVTFTREFYINFGLFLFACLALGLSIWAFATPCKKDGFAAQCEPVKKCQNKNPKKGECGSHGTKTDCGNLSGLYEACSSQEDCCGDDRGFMGQGKLKCIPDSIYCPSCK